jgi:uncharacterized protein (TIGR03086 family)
MTDQQPSVPTLSPDDPRSAFGRAVATARVVIAAVRPEQLDLPTPCDEFTVRDLLGHVLSALDRVAVVGRGEDPFAPGTVRTAPVVADDGWADAWTQCAHGVQAVWSDPALLDRSFSLPWATTNGAGILAFYTGEITVHTWDLATATGIDAPWDAQVVEVAEQAIRASMPAEGRLAIFEAVVATMPEDQRTDRPPFQEAVPASEEAPALDRLVAFAGRHPA